MESGSEPRLESVSDVRIAHDLLRECTVSYGE